MNVKTELSKYAGSKILVTGGAGFIGSHLVEKLLVLGAEVTVIDTMLCGNKIAHLQGRKNLSVHELDVNDIPGIKPLFKGQDMVFHLAAVVGVEETQDEPVKLLNVEVVGTSVIIALAAENKVKRFIFASSSEVYGDSAKPMVEEGPYNPKSTYALTKLVGEHFVQPTIKNSRWNIPRCDISILMVHVRMSALCFPVSSNVPWRDRSYMFTATANRHVISLISTIR